MTGTLKDLIIAIKGGGEMATGIAWRLFQTNFKQIFMLERKNPMAVRRRVSFCEALHEGTIIVEGVAAKKVSSTDQFVSAWNENRIPILIDPEWTAIKTVQPHVVIDAILAKKNLGTDLLDARLVIGLGPGFEAGKDVHMVIETNRGHNLGKVILKGCPEPNTGIPGSIGGYTRQRVLRSPCAGIFTSSLTIGTPVKKGDVIGHVGNEQVFAEIDGILRGLIRKNTIVTGKLKIGDIDPRGNKNYCDTISEKARAIGGSVLEAVLREYNH
ncbi:MAG: EF2563 family selenium-dependent molybdenum hydroxylase system protein [Proteobacteria bacterium]|nr:EF2563 family selenium-dependent molybdenum hydroxylase system protein [Pseudomonadota bacterium]MBU1583329.1 EF2563 family selenium-dependent molybdenum hydroxylase system protein [Pseudomonadota bacterium]MBU2453435.1 EF2563 family selenium-dependent molybdenum hydroxylase system protein [Pseudomonadota bacterium]